jgi:hypothetical protein
MQLMTNARDMLLADGNLKSLKEADFERDQRTLPMRVT